MVSLDTTLLFDFIMTKRSLHTNTYNRTKYKDSTTHVITILQSYQLIKYNSITIQKFRTYFILDYSKSNKKKIKLEVI